MDKDHHRRCCHEMTYEELAVAKWKAADAENQRLRAALQRLVEAIAHPSICPGCKNGSRRIAGITHKDGCAMLAARVLLAEKEAGA